MNLKTINNKRAVVYCRVSTKEQVDDGNSLVTQEKSCKEYALKNGYEIAKIFVERGESAKTANRTELQKMLAYCSNRKNPVSVIIVYKIDRLSRNTYDYGSLKVYFKKYGIAIKSVSENLENTPTGNLMETMLSGFAQFDNDVRAERCSGGMREAVREGRWVWLGPVGYKMTRVLGKATITQNEMAPLILKAFEMLSLGIYPVDEVLRVMTKEGLVFPSGKKIGKTYFHKIIRNKLYCGIMEKFGEVHKGKFEPIITENLFNQVQRVLKNNGHKTTQYKTDNPDFPLRKFVKNENGISLTGYWAKGRSEKYPYYRFISGDNHKKDEFTKKYCEFLDKYSFNTRTLEKLKTKLKEHLKKATGSETRDAQKMDERLVEIKQIQSSLIQKNVKGIINDELLKEQLAMLEKEIFDIQSSLISFRKTELNPDELIAFAEEFLLNPSAVWKKSDLETQTKLQRFEFPQGVVFSNGIFRTAKVACVFKAKEAFSASLSTVVDYSLEFSNQIMEELVYLGKILMERK